MSFNSVEFVIFFCVVVCGYFLTPRRWTWAFLLAASYFFYMSWNWKYAILILFSTLVTYASGLLISRENSLDQPETRKRQRKRGWVAGSFAVNLAILYFFKYYNFSVSAFTAALDQLNLAVNIPYSSFLLPVGISFYTFQALSYTMDVYRGEIAAEKHFGHYALFVSFFPQLVAGPIEKSKNLLPQLKTKVPFDYDRFKQGLLLMAWGFFKKIVIADRLAVLVNAAYQAPQNRNGTQLLVATVFFAFQIYCDFSGYSDIATGCARVLGYRLMRNFDAPYFAGSIAEFWRKWHISLSAWFRDYLYIPLGGNRKGSVRTYLNLGVVFLLSGLWHGANWTFLAWGALHGLYQIIGKLTARLRSRLYEKLKIRQDAAFIRLCKAVLIFGLVCLAWIFFRADSIEDAFLIIRKLPQLRPYQLRNGSLLKLGLDKANFSLSLLAIGLLLLVDYGRQRVQLFRLLERRKLIVRWLLYLILFFSLILLGYYGGIDEAAFIYFQF